MSDWSFDTYFNISSDSRQGFGGNSENGGRAAPSLSVAGNRNPPLIRKTHKRPETLRFINRLPLDAKLEINAEIEGRNRERAKRRWQWHCNPRGDEPLDDDEPVLAISEDELERLSDPIFSNAPMPFFIKEEISSRKQRPEFNMGVGFCSNPNGTGDRRRRVDGSFLRNIAPRDSAEIWIPQIFYDTADLFIYIPLHFFDTSALLYFQRHELEILHDSKTINNLTILDAKALTRAVGGIGEGYTSFTYERFLTASTNFLRFQASRDILGDLGDWAKNWVLHFQFFSSKSDASLTFRFWKMDEIRLRCEMCQHRRAFDVSVYEEIYLLAQTSLASLPSSNNPTPPSVGPSSLSKCQSVNKNSPQPIRPLRKVNMPPALKKSYERGPDRVIAVSKTAHPGNDNIQALSQAPMNANGLFNGAHDLILYQPVIKSINETKEQVFQWLAQFTMSGAEFDASGHVPGCHPGTRITILERMKGQVSDTQRDFRILWLRGPAGVGKSAVLQSLAEQLSKTSNLGATLFFSRPNGRHTPEYVIPTIAYQLAVRIPTYKEYVKKIMVDNPKVLEKEVERQFQTLIVEPFTRLPLRAEGGGWVILLDGLDECQGENAQVLIVNLISRFTCQHPTAPLVWVIASRPEAHLQAVFNSKGVRGSFREHEVLPDSDGACLDVEVFLRTKFGEIRDRYKDLIPADRPWPAERDIARVSTTSSGLFALATTIAHYVGDPDAGNPVSQLAKLLSRTEGLEPGSLSALYAMYSAILDGVPKSLSPILKLVLPFYIENRLFTCSVNIQYPLVVFATIFGFQQDTVYGALRKLHSVVKVPPLDQSGRLGIGFYHASFSDYLRTLEEYTIGVDMVRKCWWGLFAMLHGGNSIAYENAISNGGPQILLSWDVKLHDRFFESLWLRGILFLLRHLSPQGPNDPRLFGHVHLFSDAQELQRAFEKVDFSALFHKNQGDDRTLSEIHYLFNWLLGGVPAELSKSGVVTKTSMKNLDLACISKEKSSCSVLWEFRDRRGIFRDTTAYTTQQSQGSRSHSVSSFEELASDLSKLQSENPMVDVLVVGRQPSQRCALIRTETTDAGSGRFYYISYCG